MKLILPYPPSVNRYWLHTRTGQTYLSREGREFREAVVGELLGQAKLNGRLTVSIALYPRDRRQRDIDNGIKPTLDALQHGRLFENDSQVKRLLVEMHDDEPVKGGEMVVQIEELN